MFSIASGMLFHLLELKADINIPVSSNIMFSGFLLLYKYSFTILIG
jgi:hypothetical protein